MSQCFPLYDVGTLRLRYGGHQRDASAHLLVAGSPYTYECVRCAEARGFEFTQAGWQTPVMAWHAENGRCFKSLSALEAENAREGRFKAGLLRPCALSESVLARPPPSTPRFRVVAVSHAQGRIGLSLKMEVALDCRSKAELSGIAHASLELEFAPLIFDG